MSPSVSDDVSSLSKFTRDEDYERSFGGKPIAAGLSITMTPMDDVSAAPLVEVAEGVEAELVKDEVRRRILRVAASFVLVGWWFVLL